MRFSAEPIIRQNWWRNVAHREHPLCDRRQEDYLSEESVQNSICFFRLIEQTEKSENLRELLYEEAENTQQREIADMCGDISGMEICAKYFWKLEWSDMAGKWSEIL